MTHIKNKQLKKIMISFLVLVTLFGYAKQNPVSLKTAVTQNISASLKPTPLATLSRPEVQSFITQMVNKHHFNKNNMRQIFSQVHLRPRIIKTIHSPKEATPWHQYKPIFITQKRIAAGLDFWHKHADQLKEAVQSFGVPAPIILGVLGVETFYGKSTGSHSALDALSTLAFNYPERSKFFTSELEALFLLAREQHFDPLTLKSSYAGALGYPQFMPSSYRDYAIDFSHDGIADLLKSPQDAIGSIANYLSKKGTWQAQKPIVLKATLMPGLTLPKKAQKKIRTLAELADLGISIQQYNQSSLDQKTKATVFQLQEKDSLETYIGFHNFKAILRYNPRINYAMAVISLANAIEEAKTEEMSAKVRPLITDSPILASKKANKSDHRHG